MTGCSGRKVGAWLAAFAATAGLGACSVPPRADAPAGTEHARDCAQRFVDIVSAASGCGFALTAAGALLHEGRTIADPLIASYRQDGGGAISIAAGKVVLFPASPSGRFRIVQACENAAGGLCWKVLVFDRETGRLSDAAAGKYGPERWLSWSPDERHAVLVSRSDGASWLHVVESASGRSVALPRDGSGENWQLRPETLAWTGLRSFTVTVARCMGCTPAREEMRF